MAAALQDAARVLRMAGQDLGHAQFIRTKNTFVDIVLPADDSDDEASSPMRLAPRSRSCGPTVACPSTLACGGPSAPSPQQLAPPRGHSSCEILAAAHGRSQPQDAAVGRSSAELPATVPGSALPPAPPRGRSRSEVLVATPGGQLLPAAPRIRTSSELLTAASEKLADGFVAVVRNTFVEVRDTEADAEVGQLRRSRSHGPPVSTSPSAGASAAGSERGSSQEGVDGVARSHSRGRADQHGQPSASGASASGAVSHGTAHCSMTPVKAGILGARNGSPGSVSSCRQRRGSLAEWSPGLPPATTRKDPSAAFAAAVGADTKRGTVQLELEKILWGRSPGKCLQGSGDSSSEDSSSDDSDCELTRRHLNAELTERIRRYRQRAGLKRS